MAAPSEGKCYKLLARFYDDGGKMVARYDKIHLFSLDLGKERFREEGTLEPGKHVKVVDSPFGRIGLSVCYEPAISGVVSGHERRRHHRCTLGCSPDHRQGALGIAGACTRHREPGLCPCTGTGWLSLSGRETTALHVVDPGAYRLAATRIGRRGRLVNPAYQASLRKSLPALTHR